MRLGICMDCINRKICGKSDLLECGHFDVELTRGEIINLIDDTKGKNPTFVPQLLDAVKETYRINIASY